MLSVMFQSLMQAQDLPSYSEAMNETGSASATDYKFELDFTGYFSSAASKSFFVQATDADGNTKKKANYIVAVDITAPVDSFLDEVLNSRHSRIPVYEGEIDNIIGILSMKDFVIEANKKDKSEIDIRSIMQPPYFVPENRATDSLFQEMQKTKRKMTVLVDDMAVYPVL